MKAISKTEKRQYLDYEYGEIFISELTALCNDAKTKGFSIDIRNEKFEFDSIDEWSASEKLYPSVLFIKIAPANSRLPFFSFYYKHGCLELVVDKEAKEAGLVNFFKGPLFGYDVSRRAIREFVLFLLSILVSAPIVYTISQLSEGNAWILTLSFIGLFYVSFSQSRFWRCRVKLINKNALDYDGDRHSARADFRQKALLLIAGAFLGQLANPYLWKFLGLWRG